MIKVYNKLVRDKIPETIESAGKRVECETLDEGEYLKALDAKLSEELGEYLAERDVAELADLLEVVYAVAVARGCSREQLERIRAEKAERRGVFEKRILLRQVSDAE